MSNDFENQDSKGSGLPKGKENSPHHSYRCWGKSRLAYLQEVQVYQEADML